MNVELLNLFDYERAAEAIMPASYYEYYSGGVADNLTRDENRRAFNRLRLRPRVFRGLSEISCTTEVMGITQNAPILISPAAAHKLANPDGEVAMARAAKAVGVTQLLSTMSNSPVHEVVSAGYSTWFQLYIFRDRAWSERIVRNAEEAGCQALVVTVDVPVPGLRENLVRAKFKTPPEAAFPNLVAADPSAPADELMTSVAANFDPSITWADLEWLKSLTNLPIWVKGVLRGDDAQRAVDAGVAGIIVSNHGGRQLDTAVASIDALAEVSAAVGDQVELLMDGGVRRGSDVLKAIALGAKAVLLGRPPLWGLAINGVAGAQHVLELLKAELINVMAQCGCNSLDEITSDLIANIRYE